MEREAGPEAYLSHLKVLKQGARVCLGLGFPIKCKSLQPSYSSVYFTEIHLLFKMDELDVQTLLVTKHSGLWTPHPHRKATLQFELSLRLRKV